MAAETTQLQTGSTSKKEATQPIFRQSLRIKRRVNYLTTDLESVFVGNQMESSVAQLLKNNIHLFATHTERINSYNSIVSIIMLMSMFISAGTLMFYSSILEHLAEENMVEGLAIEGTIIVGTLVAFITFMHFIIILSNRGHRIRGILRWLLILLPCLTIPNFFGMIGYMRQPVSWQIPVIIEGVSSAAITLLSFVFLATAMLPIAGFARYSQVLQNPK